MAGDWIKIEKATPDKPEILRIARLSDISKDEAFGKVMRFWMWLDANSVDGVVDGVVGRDVDMLVDCDGFAASLVSVSWLEIDEENEKVIIPNFDRHNGQTAKQRGLKNKRQANWRKNSVDVEPSTDTSTREEKRRVKEIKEKMFNQFWNVWPKKVGKEPAMKSFFKLHHDEILYAKILKSVKSQSLTWTDPQYIPNPSTWLNQKRWDDETGNQEDRQEIIR
ncbi:MAG: hypothetical protein QM500_08650 [Methylococcales bacterium]